MALFKGKDDSVARDKAGSARAAANESSMSIIGPGMRITGDLLTEGTVRVEGRIEGTVRAGKAVVIGKEGEVVGDVVTQDAVIGGRVQGTVIAESRLELQATARIEGQISARAQHLVLEEGCRFNGQVQMLGEEPAPRALPAGPAEDTPQSWG
ncbi:polymer-forming cytoskeletal protein [Longimicrobium sp.]|uniref:bactofilin family protein n=1 Tax=Longimicrobium sp. TaxID=2029185 RepID=UPI002B6E0E4B|nr:polymer-forming cytoskeletal protein [Longimicrobium sp.]HSU16787.1 polymer-forming cytoskeletal protein [Longimicrobium sp.]